MNTSENIAVPLSAYVITKNERHTISGCLASLDFVHEIIVVDDFSEDGTAEEAALCSAKVVSNRFTGFRDQKRFAMEQASNDWVLEIDADERVSPEMRTALLTLTKDDFERHDAFAFRRLTRFWGKWIRHSSLYPDYKVRLYNRQRGEWSRGNVHERFIPTGAVKRLSVDILHEQDLDIKRYAGRVQRYAELSAIDYAEAGRSWSWFDFLRPLHTFFYRLVIRRGFLDGIQGVMIAYFGAMGTFLKYAYLYEIRQERRHKENQ